MYIPADYQIQDQELIFEFLKNNSFGILISSYSQIPTATHLPFVIKRNGNELVLISHLAKENPHADFLEKNNEVLVVFNGPHGYISPLWYKNPINVPTWNYAAVHIQGKIECQHAVDSKLEVLKETILFYEPAYLSHFDTLPSEYLSRMYEHITAIKIRVTSIEAKFKMSQNKSKEDIEGVIQNLAKSSQLNSPMIDLLKQMNEKKLNRSNEK